MRSREATQARPARSIILATAHGSRRNDGPAQEGPCHREAQGRYHDSLVHRRRRMNRKAGATSAVAAIASMSLAREDLPIRIVAPPGTRLAREWAGRTHEVVVIESGVVYKSKAWDSLSEVARHITGKRRNGPRCFGLRHPWTMIAATS